MIYFIKQYWSIPIRIGITDDIKKRIQKLQSGSAKKISLLKIIHTENDHKARLVIYDTFQDLRIGKSRWFIPDQTMTSFLGNLENHKFYVISDIVKRLSTAQGSINKTKIKIDVDQIKQKMIAMNYNQNMLAMKIGLTRQAVSLVLINGQTSTFTAKKLVKILKCQKEEIIVDG